MLLIRHEQQYVRMRSFGNLSEDFVNPTYRAEQAAADIAAELLINSLREMFMGLSLLSIIGYYIL